MGPTLDQLALSPAVSSMRWAESVAAVKLSALSLELPPAARKYILREWGWREGCEQGSICVGGQQQCEGARSRRQKAQPPLPAHLSYGG